jgi:hypothetical protein
MARIDWSNHVVGFFSALFGILIAFELDEWKENRKEETVAANAFVRLQQEIDINRNMLHEMVNTNLSLINDLETKVLDKVDNDLIFVGTREDWNEINTNEKLSNFAFVLPIRDKQNNIASEVSVLHVVFGGLVHPTIHNSAWESAKTIGALNSMSYEKVLSLSSLYNPARLHDELEEIRRLLRNADEIRTKTELEKLLVELQDAYRIIEAELVQFDAFAGMLNEME